jgi:hypothetical protein
VIHIPDRHTCSTNSILLSQEPVYESTVSLPPAVSEAALYILGVLEDYA